MAEEISIIIPTLNRIDSLKECLTALKDQTYPKDRIEIIIIDGGTPGIENLSKEFKIIYIKQKSKGRGQARNEGIDIAKGKYILFIDDDIVATPTLIEEHMRRHEKERGIAVLGFVDFHPRIKRTELIRFLGSDTPNYFRYVDINDINNVSPRFFYTSNLSLETKWLKNDKFDPDFNSYGYEDIELGHRLVKRGLKIKYNPNAIAYHLHEFKSEEEIIERQLKNGANYILFLDKINSQSTKPDKRTFKEIVDEHERYAKINRYYYLLGSINRLINEKRYTALANYMFDIESELKENTSRFKRIKANKLARKIIEIFHKLPSNSKEL